MGSVPSARWSPSRSTRPASAALRPSTSGSGAGGRVGASARSQLVRGNPRVSLRGLGDSREAGRLLWGLLVVPVAEGKLLHKGTGGYLEKFLKN